MKTHTEKSNFFQAPITLLLFLVFLLVVSGCGESRKERDAKEEAEKQSRIHAEEARLTKLSNQILDKYNANYFPPQTLGAASFTYELQKFFDKNGERPILFRGYLEDIEKTESGSIVEFLCPLGENYFLNKTAIRFRLFATDSKITPLLNAKRGDPMLRSIRYYLESKYFVVAKIKDLYRIRMFEFHGSVKAEEVELNVDMPVKFASKGVLIDTVNMSEN